MAQLGRILAAALMGAQVWSLAGGSQAATLKTIYSFQGQAIDGAGPLGGLVTMGGEFYGTTYVGGANHSGTIFSIDAFGNEHVLYSFAGGTGDGAGPRARLTVVKGTLYGTTITGGAANMGVVFAYNPKQGYAVLHHFMGGTDGAQPVAPLTYANGLLYGTTSRGGSTLCFDQEGCGTVFSIDPASGATTVLHAFSGGLTDGVAPNAGLTYVNQTLYGTTASGGGIACFAAVGCGTVFRITLAPFSYTQLHGFGGGTDGAVPIDALTESNGILYGATKQGGNTMCGGNGCGTIYTVDESSGAVAVVYGNFGGANGVRPDSDLYVGSGKYAGTVVPPHVNRGVVLGTTTGGGSGAGMPPSGGGTLVPSGTVYALDVATGAETILYNFSGQGDGGKPGGNLLASKGVLYGETYQGGAFDSGTIFTITP